jgi:hypothetical protein
MMARVLILSLLIGAGAGASAGAGRASASASVSQAKDSSAEAKAAFDRGKAAHTGMIKEKMGDVHAAATEYRAALDLYPRHQPAAQALKKIQPR